jgi:hypothetical protein
MKKLTGKMKILALISLCSLLILPAISSAKEVVLGTVDFGPGNHTETYYLGAKAAGNMFLMASPVLKELSVEVQNGTQKDKDGVASAVISVNGDEVFIQKDFNKSDRNVSSLVRTIGVDDPEMSEVELEVKVNGSKKARLSVTLSAIYEEVADVPWFLDTDVPPNGIGGPIMGMGTINTPPPLDPRGIWVPVGGDVR